MIESKDVSYVLMINLIVIFVLMMPLTQTMLANVFVLHLKFFLLGDIVKNAKFMDVPAVMQTILIDVKFVSQDSHLRIRSVNVL